MRGGDTRGRLCVGSRCWIVGEGSEAAEDKIGL